LEPIRSLFTAHNLRCTEQRMAVYEALQATRSHPTAEELYHLARERVERLSLATVYNTLEALCEAGLARKFPMSNGCCRYDGDTSDHLHVRFRDTCEIRDVPLELGDRLVDNLPRQVLEEIERQLGIRIEGLNIQLLARRA
jgi:Fe2+ or Zn2+ uptake regulation protein